MANIVKFIRKGGRIIPIRFPLAGKNLQSAHVELGARASAFVQKASIALKKSETFSKHADKFSAMAEGKYLHVGAKLHGRAEHQLEQATKASKIASTLDNYHKAAVGAAHVARNKGKYTLAALGATLYGHQKMNDNRGGYGKNFYRTKR
jgi:hypothetical protein